MHRTETYTLKNGTGRIAVRGDRAACGLFLEGKPFAFNWADCAGSIGQDLCRFAASGNRGTVLDLAEVTAQLPAKQEMLSSRILSLLQQFPDGVYRLSLSPMAAGENWIEYEIDDGTEKDTPYPHFSGYYPFADEIYGGCTWITTQPIDRLDEDRIAHFWYAIEKGDRPFAITAAVEGGMCEFILDGHHKLMAYAYARVLPWRLSITASASPLRETDWPEGIVSPLSWHRVHGWKRATGV